MRLILRTLGGTALYVQRPGEAPTLALSGGKAFALLTALALSPHRSTERRRLLDLLWADLEPEGARNALRVRLADLRKLLGPDALGPFPDPVVLLAPVESDYHVLVAAWERGDSAAVVDGFAGDFLPGFALPGADGFEAWADAERARLRAMFARAAEVVVRERLSAGRFHDAEALARRVRDLDQSRDVGWRLLLECLVASRNALGLAVEVAALDRLAGDDGLLIEPGTRALLAQARQFAGAATEDTGASGNGIDAPAPLVAELVGREQEFAAIMRAWATARDGRVVHVHLVAPAGLGKTRLLADARGRLRAARARVVPVAAAYGARDIPYGFASDVAAALGTRRGAPGVSREAARALVALTPSLSGTFDVAPDGASGDEALRRRGLALRELLEVLTEDQPLALLLDDLHWGDPLSLRLLATAFAGLQRGHLLVVSTARHTPDELAGVLDGAVVPLSALSPEAVWSLLGSLAALPDEPWAARLAAALREATLGSPLLVLETLELLRERGLLGVGADGWACADPSRLFAALGEGSALRRRLECLTADERRLLLLLAVAGVPLSQEALTAAAGPAHDLHGALATLEHRGLVVRREETWRAAHDEHAAALLDATPTADRHAAAAAVGRALAAPGGHEFRQLQLAAGLLVRGGDEATLARLGTRFVRHRRLEGDRRSDHALARELLGVSATDALVASLVRTLPWLVRARLVSARRVESAIALVFTLVVLLPLSVAVAVRAARRPRPVAVLLAERPSADRSVVELFGVPLDAEHLASAAPFDIDVSRRPTWRLPDSVVRYAEGRSARPDGRGWVFTRTVSDSGVLDIFDVRLDGRMRRLTSASSDDLAPDWAPDGSQFAFTTMRWTTYGRLSLATYDMRTGRVRRLTAADTTTDTGPAWSPDGSRIAFTRGYAGTDRRDFCAIDAGGGHLGCRPSVILRQPVVVGWADAHHVLLQGQRNGAVALGRVDIDRVEGTAEEVIASGCFYYYPSPDGHYVLCRGSRRGYPAGSWFLFAIETPGDMKPIRLSGADLANVELSWAPTSARRPFLDTLRVTLGPGPPRLDMPYQLRATGVDTAGKPVDVGAVRWQSLDTTVATVDSSGLLRPRRAGRLTMQASAGGWRTVRATLTVLAPTASRVLLDERWTHGLVPTWRPYGVPQPKLVQSDRFGPAFLQNGDGSFSSGAYTARAFDTRGALWTDAALSVPLTTEGPSQEHALMLFTYADSTRWATWDHVTGMRPVGRRCEFYYPASPAGPPARGDSVVLRVGVAERRVHVPRRVRDGQPFRALVQLFPDGRCGFAFDGVPLWVSPPVYFEKGARVMLDGNSQDTRVLVGPLRVGTGIAPHVPWGVLDTAAAPTRRPVVAPASR